MNNISLNILKGFYLSNPINKKLNRVGQPYGSDKEKELKTKTSYSLHIDSNGFYHKNRLKLHKDIIKGILKKGSIEKKPTCILLLGGSGSGKSYLYKTEIKPSLKGDFSYLNVDEVKELLPEYSQFIKENAKTAATRVHQESADIGSIALDTLIHQKRNFVNDATLSNTDLAKKLIKKLTKAGYEIHLVGVTAKISVVLNNNKQRFKRSGRLVPEEIVREKQIKSTKSFFELKDLPQIKSIKLFDNSNIGEKPIKIYEDSVIHNQQIFTNLKKRL